MAAPASPSSCSTTRAKRARATRSCSRTRARSSSPGGPRKSCGARSGGQGARGRRGGTLAGYLAYEAGLALEPRLLPRADARTGAAGPLVWLGAVRQAETIPAAEVPAWLAEQRRGPAPLDRPDEPQISTGAYIDAFDTLQEAIRAGDIYQANLTMRLTGATRGDPLAIYARDPPGGRRRLWRGDLRRIALAAVVQPRTVLHAQGRAAKTKPMKGTRPRGRDRRPRTRALAEELAASVKDQAENLMIVDLLRNDLQPGRGRRDGAGRGALRDRDLSHRASRWSRPCAPQLQPGKGAMDMIRALFPCGSITGAPKIRAMELIDEVERDARGPYCGAIGWIDGKGDAAFNVAIRTIRLTEEENRPRHCGARRRRRDRRRSAPRCPNGANA